MDFARSRRTSWHTAFCRAASPRCERYVFACGDLVGAVGAIGGAERGAKHPFLMLERGCEGLPVAASQTRAVLSSLAVTTREPSGLNSALSTHQPRTSPQAWPPEARDREDGARGAIPSGVPRCEPGRSPSNPRFSAHAPLAESINAPTRGRARVVSRSATSRTSRARALHVRSSEDDR